MSTFPRSLVPSPLPGECLYSVAAYLAERWTGGTPKAATAFFGSARVSRDYTGNLDAVAQFFPAEMGITGRMLALKHTALPLQLAFFPDEARTRLLSAAVSSANLQLTLGVAPSRLVASRPLRFCPLCIDGDRAEHGRAYWHVDHQIVGVHVCSRHSTPLHESSVRPDWKPARGRYVTAEFAARTDSLPLAEEATPILAALAQDVRWLLGQDHCPAPGPNRIHALHRELAHSSGYSMKNGTVAVNALYQDLRAHYGQPYLEMLQGSNEQTDWVAALIRPPRAHQQPLRHLLLSRFFGLPIGDFLTRAMETIPSASVSRPHKFRIRSPIRLERLVPKKRTEWLAAIENEHGSARASHEALYAWLWRNDREWLRGHRKRPVPRQPNRGRWAQRDAELAENVRALAERLRQEPRLRVTRSAIATRSDRPSWLVRPHPFLPLTNAVIAECCETAVEHALRRIARYRDLHGYGSALWVVREGCGISVALSRTPPVAEALRAAVLGPVLQP